MLASEIISRVRDITNDTGAEPRTKSAEIMRWISDALDVALSVVPKLFSKTASMTCQSGYLQTLPFERAVAFIEVIGITRIDFNKLSAFSPNWRLETAGAAQHWSPSSAGPNTFMVHPPALANQSLMVSYVEAPTEITSETAVVPLSDNFLPALVQYCVGMTESKDDEHVNSNRAAQAKADFVAMIKGA
jgi:hypothetical protein